MDGRARARTAPVCRAARLGVASPIIGAPMAGVAHGALARAVTEGGGLGMIGVESTDRAELIAHEAPVASDSSRLPFGIGLMARALDDRPELLEPTLEARPELVSLSCGSSRTCVPALHDAGIVVSSQVQDVGAATTAGARAKVLVAGETDTVLTRVLDVAQGIGWPEVFAGRAVGPLRRSLPAEEVDRVSARAPHDC